ncbi:MAG TPA: GTP-binding protein [Pseudonocardia sp.]|nr:GTP-binding protein [Pseudonocardia sp.]
MDTELVLVGGITEDGVAGAVGRLLRVPGTAVLHHDLADVTSGVVRRRLRVSGGGLPGDRPGTGVAGFGAVTTDHTEVLELAHGCVSCTLREDVLPLVRALARRPGIGRIVLHLDPVLEPEQVCWAVLHVLVDGATVAGDVRMGGVITVLDPATWLADAVSEGDVADRGLALLPDDERTVAQLAVAQAEFADLLVYAGSGRADGDGDGEWQRARTDAVLARLTPLAPRIELTALDPAQPLAGLPEGARRGMPESPHAVLLRGQPPLGEDYGVRLMMFTARRPFHPERLHDAMDLLLDGVVRAKGRIWLATRPEAVLWVESAGGGLEVGYVDDWLAAQDDAAWAAADPERRAAAALRWQPRYGDRVQELAVLTCGADPEEIERGLRGALLTDAEVTVGEDGWRHYPDPFGWHHSEPCGEPQPVAMPTMPPLAGGPAPDRRRSTEDDARRPDPRRPGEPGPRRSREDES